MYNYYFPLIFCTIFPIIIALLTATIVNSQLTDLPLTDHDDGIVKKVKKINQDGSYTIGYLSEDGSYKIEHRDIFGNINGTFGWLDEQNHTKKVDYSSKNRTDSVKLVSIDATTPPLPGTTPTLTGAATIVSTTQFPTFVQRIPTRTTLATPTPTTGLPIFPQVDDLSSTSDNDDVYNSAIVSSRPLFTTTRHHLSNRQFFSTTPASTNVQIVQKPTITDNNNYYQVQETEPEVSEIRKRFFSAPPPVIFLPSDDDENNNQIIDEIQPPVSTHAFQMLLRHLVDRQRKLEYVNRLTRQRQATNRRRYYQQDDNNMNDEYLPINVREMLLLRMLQLAMNPALPVHQMLDAEQNGEAAQNSYYRRQHRNVEILGEDGEIRQQRRRRTKRYKKTDDINMAETEDMDYVE